MAVHLTDFGLARLAATGSRLTRTGQAIGTPAYMSPEAARGETSTLTPASDVWALGAVLYALLTGRPAFDGDAPAAVIGLVMTGTPPPLRALRPDAPLDLGRLIAAALAKSPNARPRSAAAFHDACQSVLHGQRPRLPGASRRAAIGLGAVALAAAALAVGLAVTRPRPETQPIAATAGPGVSRAEREALAAAERDWERRQLDPRRTAETLESAYGAAPAQHVLALRAGLCWWAVGEAARAREAWQRIPPDAAVADEARLYLGLEAAFRFEERSAFAVTEAKTWLAPLHDRPGRIGRLARAVGCPSIVEVRALLAADPSWEAATLLAQAEVTLPGGDLARGLAASDRALAEGLPFPWALVNRAVLRRRRGDDPGAREDLDAAVAVAPGFARARLDRAAVAMTAGDRVTAIADLDAAIAARPDRGRAYMLRGAQRRTDGDLASARADLEAAVRFDPSSGEAWERLGSLLKQLGEGAASEQAYDRALAREPGRQNARYNRAVARARRGDRAGALADYDALIAAWPADPEGRTNRGVLRYGGGDVEGARVDFDAALEASPGLPEARFGRAKLRAHLGDRAGARSDLDTLLAAHPDHAAGRALREEIGPEKIR